MSAVVPYRRARAQFKQAAEEWLSVAVRDRAPVSADELVGPADRPSARMGIGSGLSA
jgi:hypothetical protein